jgi:hypothetical protein
MEIKRSKYWPALCRILDYCFEKGKCKKRGQAIVMLAYIEMMLQGYEIDKDGKPK